MSKKSQNIVIIGIKLFVICLASALILSLLNAVTISQIEKNIEKRPVLSLPDALSTLKNRIGDCNEHAVLFAAMARAAYLPAKVEAGVVYLNGRFFYHAWNLVDLGRGDWITADALFNQLPADVTHIRLASGAQEDQLNILGLIGKLGITLLEGTE